MVLSYLNDILDLNLKNTVSDNEITINSIKNHLSDSITSVENLKVKSCDCITRLESLKDEFNLKAINKKRNLVLKIENLKSDSHLPKKVCVICFIESPLKMMKNVFYFILKALLVRKIFNFLS